MTVCSVCGKREATRSDGMCDSCRYDALLGKMVKNREVDVP
jgi:NMD protein affecting ribosome stability and mRNA decay